MDRPLSFPMTSDVRNNHRDIPGPAQVLNVPTSCAKDDIDFIQNIEAGQKMDSFRAISIWNCLEYFRVKWSPSLRRRAFLELLEGCGSDDVWLWVDGDEDLFACRRTPPLRKWEVGFEVPRCEAAAALRKRQHREHTKTPQQAELCRRVQSAEFNMREAMIHWLVCTSGAWKKADHDTGRSDREICDLYCLIDDWSSTLTWVVKKWLRDRSGCFDLGPFDSAMVAQNHTCHRVLTSYERDIMKDWLYMMSSLFPGKRVDDLYLSRSGSRLVTCYGCCTTR